MPHILLIEDNEHQRRIMRERLQSEGYQVTDTPYGDEGVRMAKSQLPDLLVIDIMVPHMNGWEVMEAINADAQLKDIPFVVLSGAKTLPQDIERSISLGAQAHFCKGITPMDDMLREIRFILGLKKILMVDANAQRSNEVREMLQRHRFLVTVMSIGADAINRFHRIRPDAVIVTDQIIGMSPFVILQRVRQISGMEELPVISLGDGTPISLPGKSGAKTKALAYPCTEKELISTIQLLFG